MNSVVPAELIMLEQALRLLDAMGKKLYGEWVKRLAGANPRRPLATDAKQMLDLLETMGEESFRAMTSDAFGGGGADGAAMVERQENGRQDGHRIIMANKEMDTTEAPASDKKKNAPRPPAKASGGVVKPRVIKVPKTKEVKVPKPKPDPSSATSWSSEQLAGLRDWVKAQLSGDASLGTRPLVARAKNELAELVIGRSDRALEAKIHRIRSGGNKKKRSKSTAKAPAHNTSESAVRMEKGEPVATEPKSLDRGGPPSCRESRRSLTAVKTRKD